MSAETLRRAAELMRERAEVATAGTWTAEVLGSEGYAVRAPATGGDTPRARLHRPTVARCGWEEWETDRADAEHIASWHPAIALAVADWLGSVAMDVDKRDNPKRVGGRYEALRIPDELAALAVARAYLGESA